VDHVALAPKIAARRRTLSLCCEVAEHDHAGMTDVEPGSAPHLPVIRDMFAGLLAADRPMQERDTAIMGWVYAIPPGVPDEVMQQINGEELADLG
jgi:hypothetical protein